MFPLFEELMQSVDVSEIDVMGQLALAYYKSGRYAESEGLFRNALAEYKKRGVKNPLLYTKIMMGLAETYRKTGQNEEALMYYGHLIRQENEQYSYCRYQKLLLSLDDSNWKEHSEELMNMALDYENESKMDRAGEIFADLASIYLRYSNFEQADDLAHDALLVLPALHSARGRAHRVLASVCFHEQKAREGQEHLEQAVAAFEQSNMLEELDEALTTLCDHLKEIGQLEEAFHRLASFKDHLMKKAPVRAGDGQSVRQWE